jgi:hypothetical protein
MNDGKANNPTGDYKARAVQALKRYMETVDEPPMGLYETAMLILDKIPDYHVSNTHGLVEPPSSRHSSLVDESTGRTVKPRFRGLTSEEADEVYKAVESRLIESAAIIKENARAGHRTQIGAKDIASFVHESVVDTVSDFHGPSSRFHDRYHASVTAWSGGAWGMNRR